MNKADCAPPLAVDRMCAALSAIGFVSGQTVLDGFGDLYEPWSRLSQAAASQLELHLVDGADLLADDSAVATGFIGTPDRLFALCREGYGSVLTHALLAGGAVFPIVYGSARDHGIALGDVLHADGIGPFALRTSREGAHALLEGVNVSICRPGSTIPLAHGLVGEVVVHAGASSTDADAGSVRTGMLSAMEQVPHRYRAPGLQGWMGFVQPSVELGSGQVRLEDLAQLVADSDMVLDARLVTQEEGGSPPVLQVETEAGDWIEADVAARFKSLTGLTAQLQRVRPGSFANTGRPFVNAAA